jgi:signal transduction histidine kinase
VKERFRNLSIRWKLTIVSATACGAALVIASGVFFAVDQLTYRLQMLRRVTVLARVVGSNSTAALAFHDRRVADRILAGLDNEREVLFACLRGEDGRQLAVYRRADMARDWQAPMHEEEGHAFKEKVLCVRHGVTLDGDDLGSVHIVYSLRALRLRFARYGLVVLVVMGLSVLTAWLLSFRLQEHVSSRIVRLQKTADRVWREDDFTVRAESDPADDEIGALVREFNQMLECIGERNEELRNNQRRLRAMASRLVLTEERERRRVAEGLHDSICQILFVANLKLKMLLKHCGSDCAEELQATADLVNDALTEARSFTYQLSPPVLYQFGLGPALSKLAEQRSAEYGLDIVFEDDEEEKPVSEDVSVLLYRAVRELLMNAYKHAQASSVTVGIGRNEHCVRITVSDNGVGFDPEAISDADETGGYGLFSLRERFLDIGGRFEIVSRPGQGTTATLEAALWSDEE